MRKTKAEQIKTLETGYNVKKRDLPKLCYRRGRKGYVYFIRGHFCQRMPEPTDESFEAAYLAALKGAPRADARPAPELFQGSGISEGVLQDTAKQLERAARQRSSGSDREYDLPEGWVAKQYSKQKGRCAVSGLLMRKPERPWDKFGPSLDRIDSKTGYTPENCQLVILGVNLSKNDMTQDDFILICEAVAKRQKNR